MNSIIDVLYSGSFKEYYSYGFVDKSDLVDNMEEIMRIADDECKRIIVKHVMDMLDDILVLRALSCTSLSFPTYTCMFFDPIYMNLLLDGRIKITSCSVVSLPHDIIQQLEYHHVYDSSCCLIGPYLINRRLGRNLIVHITDDMDIEMLIQMHTDGVMFMLVNELSSITMLEDLYYKHNIMLGVHVQYDITIVEHLISYIKMGYILLRNYTIDDCGSLDNFDVCHPHLTNKSIVYNMIRYGIRDGRITTHCGSIVLRTDHDLIEYSLMTHIHHLCTVKFSDSLTRLDIMVQLGYRIKYLDEYIKLSNLIDQSLDIKNLGIRDVVCDNNKDIIGLMKVWKKHYDDPLILKYYLTHHNSIIHLLYPRIHDKFMNCISYSYPPTIKNNRSVSDVLITTTLP